MPLSGSGFTIELTESQIPILAQKFSGLQYDPNAERSVEPFGSAFVWSDEHPGFQDDEHSMSPLKFLQYLVWYRKSLIERKPFEPFAKYWDLFKSECPTWPGFRAERCDPSLWTELESDVESMYQYLERALEICERKRQRDENAG
ncbi:hypothetical protein N9B04_00710 [bacterium]|nr:hypothetical protein [bacterium]